MLQLLWVNSLKSVIHYCYIFVYSSLLISPSLRFAAGRTNTRRQHNQEKHILRHYVRLSRNGKELSLFTSRYMILMNFLILISYTFVPLLMEGNNQLAELYLDNLHPWIVQRCLKWCGVYLKVQIPSAKWLVPVSYGIYQICSDM